MRVTVAGRPAPVVLVVSSTELRVKLPPGPAGVAALRVDNIDPAGQSLAGETVTVAAAITYARRDLSVAAAEPILARATRALIRLVKEQVLAETVNTTSTDFDASTADNLNIVELAKLPAVILNGPQLAENRFYTSNVVRRTAPDAAGVQVELGPVYTADMRFNLVGASDSENELLRLQQELVSLFQRVIWLDVPRDFADLSKGYDRFELDFAPDGDFQTASAPNVSNVRQFTGTVIIRGVELSDVAVPFAGADPTATSTPGLGLTAPVTTYTPPGALTPEQSGRPAGPFVVLDVQPTSEE